MFKEEEAAEKKKEEEKQKKKEGGQQGAGRTAEKFGAVRSADARPSSECGRGPIDGRLWACALAA